MFLLRQFLSECFDLLAGRLAGVFLIEMEDWVLWSGWAIGPYRVDEVLPS